MRRYETAAPTPTADRKCEDNACPPEHFRLSVDPALPVHCQAWRTCDAAAEFQAKAPSATHDRECNATTTCLRPPSVTDENENGNENENEQDGGGDRVDEWEEAAATATSDRVCTACDVCTDGDTEVAECTATTNTVCQRCACEPGSFLSQGCTGGEDNGVCEMCSTCPVGHFRSGGCEDGVTDGTECQRCSGCVQGEEYAASPCTATHDIVCKPLTACVTDLYLEAPLVDGEPRLIPEELEAAPPTETTDRVCARYSPPCSADEFELTPYNLTHDRECRPLSNCTNVACPQSSWDVKPPAGGFPRLWYWQTTADECADGDTTCVSFPDDVAFTREDETLDDGSAADARYVI